MAIQRRGFLKGIIGGLASIIPAKTLAEQQIEKITEEKITEDTIIEDNKAADFTVASSGTLV